MLDNVPFQLDFLGDEEVHIPSGTTFVPTGLIGNWHAGIVFTVGWTPVDLADGTFKFSARSTARSGSFNYYFHDLETATEAQKYVGKGDFAPGTVWRFEAPLSTVLNLSEEYRSSFSDPVAYDVNVKTPASKKYRHAFHLIALPMFVQALAMKAGILTDPIFNANELLFPEREGEDFDAQGRYYDDAFQASMIGDPEDKSAGAMIESVLGTRRAELWAALGETNPLAYVRKGSNAKFVTQSPVLSSLLAAVDTRWKSPLWSEVVTFFDPRADATMEDDSGERRLRIAAITRIFANQAAAKAEADKQLEQRAARAAGASADTGSGSVVTTNSKPALPKAWDGMEADWLASIRDYWKNATGPNPIKFKRLGDELTATSAEVQAWVEYLGL